jgi:hypothetical protein
LLKDLGRHQLICGGNFLIAEVLREPEGSTSPFFHRTLDGFLVSAQGLAPDGIFQIARLNVEQNVYLPWLEGVTVHGATQKVVDQLVKSAQNRFAIKSLYWHTQSTNRQVRA